MLPQEDGFGNDVLMGGAADAADTPAPPPPDQPEGDSKAEGANDGDGA